MGIKKGIPRNFQQNFTGYITNFSIDEGTSGRIIPFTFSPSSMSDSISASFSQTVIPGASAPQITYTATGARKVSFSIDLPLDYIPPNSSYSTFEDYLNAFRALVYPKYSSTGGKVASPHCKLNMSNLELDGVCDSCNIEYKTDRYANNGSMSASISLSFTEVISNVNEVDATWIANSKVTVVSSSSVSSSGSSSQSSQQQSNSGNNTNVTPSVTLKGNASYSFNMADIDFVSAKMLIDKGLWKDPGYSYTHKDVFNVKVLYGTQINATTTTLSDLHLENYSWYATIPTSGSYSRKVKFITASNKNSFCAVGNTVTIFIVYLPYGDGNKYYINNAKIRTIKVKRTK